MDPIADMLNRIRNAQAVGYPMVEFPFSNIKYEIAKILAKQGFIEKVERKGKKTKKMIEIILKYTSRDISRMGSKYQDKTPVISGLKRISKSGQRIYLDSSRIKQVKGGHGIAIVSTSKGLMTGREAKKQKIGGEVLCEIW